MKLSLLIIFSVLGVLVSSNYYNDVIGNPIATCLVSIGIIIFFYPTDDNSVITEPTNDITTKVPEIEKETITTIDIAQQIRLKKQLEKRMHYDKKI